MGNLNADYSKMTDDEFQNILEELVGQMSPAEIMAVPGAYEVFSEALNNDVLDTWADRNEEKAFPGGTHAI